MPTIRKPSVGSISHGTLLTPDLLEAFGWELQHISDLPAHQELANEARSRAHYFTWNDLPEGETVEETEDDANLLDMLFAALAECAPPYCGFGAHEGDGSDFGFWPSMEAINDLPRIQMVEGEDVPDEDHAFVNDHGNVTVFGADGTVLLELV